MITLTTLFILVLSKIIRFLFPDECLQIKQICIESKNINIEAHSLGIITIPKLLPDPKPSIYKIC